MILTCPQCSTRYQADAAKFQPAGRNVRCAKCSHLWHQDPPPSEIDAASDIAIIDDTPPPEAAPPPPPPAPEPMPARPAAFTPNPVISRETVRMVETPPAPKSRLPGQLAVALGWVGLIVLILLVGWTAMTFRQQIATVWPQSASVYAALGMKTNATGIDIQDVSFQRSTEAGQSVLTVSGVIANPTAHELPVSPVRVALIDDDRHELYHWTFVPNVMTLRAGQTAKFTTRINNPPAGARHFELRFTKAGE